MAALKSRRVRLIFFLGVAAIAFVAAYVVATSEAKPSNVQMALVILGLLALFEPLRIAWEIITAKDEIPAQSNRQILINTVRKNWIQGVLQDALRDAEFEVYIKPTAEDPAPKPQPVEQSQGIFGFIKTVLLRGDAPPASIPNTPDSLAQTFKNANHKLLILGAPGGGKTVLLLQLAQHLLEEAKTKGKPVPVVFNLSSWGATGGSMKDWLIAELKRNYGANTKYAKELINGDSLIYLLDGLDEVAKASRDKCVAELNTFITLERQLVVCSRTAEYGELTTKLSISEAVEAQPLTETQFEAYLKQHISSETVANIIATLREDDDVWGEANKPLFINILISTYRDGKPFQPEQIQGDTRQKVQNLLIEPYVVRQLQNVPNAPYASAETRRHLAWIGWWMNKREQTVFYLEGLQAEGLPRPQVYRLFNVLVGGVVGGLFFGLDSINMEIKLSFKFTHERLVGGLVIGLIGLLFWGLVIEVGGLAILLNAMLVVPLIGMLVGKGSIVQRGHPGQGIWDTLVVGLVVGLGDVYKHFLLRGFLHRQELLPFRTVQFLHYARERRLLRQVGGGFIFIHRYVLDYFDDEFKARYLKKNAGG
ncbi:MAG: NACHT domain-containing protein [Anaerolineae bacterium]|nr:NACHT domain-containing protein [Anaerolineae bacterium]